MSLSFLAPNFLWLLLGIPLVILLHFVRARKRRQDVSAIFLWRRARELANAQQRFAPSWLLLLQIVFVALASLALSQPNLSFRGPPDRVFVIDASASMAARDSDGVRIDKVKRQVETMLNQGGRVAMIRAGLDATIIQSLTSDRGDLRRALGSLVPSDRGADLERALELALALNPEGEVHLFTDQPPLPGRIVTYHLVAGDGQNLGISTFDIGIQQAYVAVVSNSPRPQQVTLEILHQGRPVAQTVLLVPAGGQANATFPLQSGSGIYEARLQAPDWDALELDNSAFAGSQDLRVVVDNLSVPLARALDAIPRLSWRVTSLAAGVTGADVRILTGADPGTLGPGSYLLFAAPSEEAEFFTVRDWDQSDPLLRFVDLRETVVGLDPSWQGSEDDDWEVLARTADLTPVLRRLDTSELHVVQAAFHPSQTDMVFRPAFPALITNILREFRGEDRLPLGSPLPAGSTRQGEEVERATVPGIYTVGNRGYSASLLSAVESRLPIAVEGGERAPENESVREAQRYQRSVALWLIVAALAALIAEWLLWSRARGGWVSRQ
ncbi:MAG: BatA and WFA domain-containing protein [Trueperaceae bacterium]|nr:MAG: BatA and WFA domain-containing protein [Trueperaceae bacterium]